MQYALNWLNWQRTGKTHYKNPREMKRHKPKPEALAEAQKILTRGEN